MYVTNSTTKIYIAKSTTKKKKKKDRKKYSNMLRKEGNWNHITGSVKATKCRKIMEDRGQHGQF